MTTTLQPVERRAPLSRRQRWALAVLVLPVLLIAVSMTVLGFATTAIAESLDPSGTQLLWIVDVYGFVLAGLLVTMGSIGDRIGRRRLLLIGTAGFALASVAAAYAPTAEALIAARAVQGVAAATLMPSTLALMRNLFTDDRQRLFAIAVWAAGFSAGSAAGPVVGGWMLEHFWWGSVFLLIVPVSVAVLAAAPFVLPESKDPNPGSLDWGGVVLSFLAMFPFAYGVKSLAEHGLVWDAVLALAVAAAAGIAFVRRQRRSAHPLIDMRLFGIRRFSAAIATNFVIVFGLVAVLYLLPQYLQLVLGYSPMKAGLLLVPGMVVSVVAGLVAVRLSERFGMARIIVGGLAVMIAGMAAMALAGAESGAVIVMCAYVLVGLGSGLVQTVTNDAVLAAAPPDRAGAAAAISETAYELGAAMGVAVLGSVATAVYRSQMSGAPDAAKETLAEAVSTAGTLSAEAGAALLRTAQAAFTSGLRTTAVIAVVLLAGAAVAIGRALRTEPVR